MQMPMPMPMPTRFSRNLQPNLAPYKGQARRCRESSRRTTLCSRRIGRPHVRPPPSYPKDSPHGSCHPSSLVPSSPLTCLNHRSV